MALDPPPLRPLSLVSDDRDLPPPSTTPPLFEFSSRPPSFSAPAPSTSYRRLSARPSPLVLKPASTALTFQPRSSSLGLSSQTTTFTTTVTSDRRFVGLASLDESQASHESVPETKPASGVQVPAIRRKPLAGNTATTTATTSATAAAPFLLVASTLDFPPGLDDGLGLHPDDGVASFLDYDYLTTPDQRFTRPGSVDSPTLYEFPSGSSTGLLTPLPSVLNKDQASATVAKSLDTVADATRAAEALAQNSTESAPAASQTPTTAAVSQHAPAQEGHLKTTAYFGTGPISSDGKHPSGDPDAEPIPQDISSAITHFQDQDPAMSSFVRKASPPDLHLQFEKDESVYSAYNEDKEKESQEQLLKPINTAIGSNPASPKPKSPSSPFKLGSLFNWSASPSTTHFSDRGFSPLPSPSSPQPPDTSNPHVSPAHGTQSSNNNGNYTTITERNISILSSATHASLEYCEDLETPSISDASPTKNVNHSTLRVPLSPATAHSLSFSTASVQLEEMEDELKAIGAELAASIRREMDLEDLVDRLQAEISNSSGGSNAAAQGSAAVGAPGKRTSDYFSDSGYTPSKYSDYDAAKEEISQIQRRAEQEKAQIRLELTDKLTDERMRRRALDEQIRVLQARATEYGESRAVATAADASDGASAALPAATADRVKQLESICEDLRRRLSEERGVKENFEDLLTAMKSELQSTANERDNLRDEVLPQLRARVEGLESQAADHARQIYESTKAQQLLQLQSSGDGGLVLQQPPQGSLRRSNTVDNRPMPSGLGMNQTSSTVSKESREALAERLKDVEAQRDALHSALKNLLERQEYQNRENAKKIRTLEQDRQRLLTAGPPQRAGYERDVSALRNEVSVLRRRAEEALEQKWQVEKGLQSLRMDLDRAEEEIAQLRSLLIQHDILAEPSTSAGAPATRALFDSASAFDSMSTTVTMTTTPATSLSPSSSAKSLLPVPPTSVTSASLLNAYQNLQRSYADALVRLRQLGGGDAVTSMDEKTMLALQRLEQALAMTVAECDAARLELDAAHGQSKSEKTASAASETPETLDSESSLAGQLDASARRVEELAQQVRVQLATNAQLRERLSGMVARAAADQQTYAARVAGLEARLRTLEEQLVRAQTAAEERVARHEAQINALKEAHNSQLQRLREGVSPAVSPRMGPVTATSGLNGLKSPTSPLFSVNGRLVPPAAPTSRPSSRGSATSSGGVGGGPPGTTPSVADQQRLQEQQAQIMALRGKVGDLETALATAEREMQEVVGRMSSAQIEVMQLQEEREVAMRESRRLQKQLEAEQVKAFQERFRQLGQLATAA